MRRRFNRGGWRGPGPPTGPFEINRESPQARGLVAWWPLNFSFGSNVVFDRFRRNHGDLGTGSEKPTWTAIAKKQNVLYFDLGDVVWVPDSSDFAPLANSLSIVAWLYPTTITNFRVFVDKSGGNDDAFRLMINSSTQFRWRTPEHGNLDGGTPIINTWQLVVATWDGSTKKIYHNGNEVASGSASGAITIDSQSLAFGRDISAGQNFLGYLADIRLHKVGLSPLDAHHIYKNPYDLYKPILPKFVVVAPAAPGGDLSISVSDSVTVSESVTMEVTSFVDVSDSIAAAETVTLLIENIISTSDSISVSEAINLAIAQQIGVSDSISVSDTPTLMVDENIDVSDSVSVSESVSVSVVDAGTITISVSDSISVSDTPALMVDENIDVSDSVTVSESVTMLGTSFIDVSDSVSVSESVSVSLVTVGTLTISVSDSVTVSESVTMALTPLLINVSESITVADVVTISLLVGLIDLTLRDRDTSLTLRDRDTSLTLNERY